MSTVPSNVREQNSDSDDSRRLVIVESGSDVEPPKVVKSAKVVEQAVSQKEDLAKNSNTVESSGAKTPLKNSTVMKSKSNLSFESRVV
jgi:hypothetical protein